MIKRYQDTETRKQQTEDENYDHNDLPPTAQGVSLPMLWYSDSQALFYGSLWFNLIFMAALTILVNLGDPVQDEYISWSWMTKLPVSVRKFSLECTLWSIGGENLFCKLGRDTHEYVHKIDSRMWTSNGFVKGKEDEQDMDSGDSEDHLRNLEQSVSQDKWFREEMIQKFHCDKLYIVIYQRDAGTGHSFILLIWNSKDKKIC